MVLFADHILQVMYVSDLFSSWGRGQQGEFFDWQRIFRKVYWYFLEVFFIDSQVYAFPFQSFLDPGIQV